MLYIRLLAYLILLPITSCDQASSPAFEERMSSSQTVHIWHGHHTRSHSTLEATMVRTAQLLTAIDVFLKQPSSVNMQQSRSSWLELHQSITELNFFFSHLLGMAEPAVLMNRIDPWPLEPGFLDSLPDYPHSGIINDITLPLDESRLISQHQLTSDEEISLGLHALEFLLWQRKPEDYLLQSIWAEFWPATG